MEIVLKSYFVTLIQVLFFHIHFCYFFNIKTKILPAIYMFISIRLAVLLNQNWKVLVLVLLTSYIYNIFSKVEWISCIKFYIGYLFAVTLYQYTLFYTFGDISWKQLFYDNYLIFLFFALFEFLILTFVFIIVPYFKRKGSFYK